MTRGDGETVMLEFPVALSVRERETFHIDADIPLPQDVARQLGARGDMVVMAGQYRPTWSRDGRQVRVVLRVSGEWTLSHGLPRG